MVLIGVLDHLEVSIMVFGTFRQVLQSSQHAQGGRSSGLGKVIWHHHRAANCASSSSTVAAMERRVRRRS